MVFPEAFSMDFPVPRLPRDGPRARWRLGQHKLQLCSADAARHSQVPQTEDRLPPGSVYKDGRWIYYIYIHTYTWFNPSKKGRSWCLKHPNAVWSKPFLLLALPRIGPEIHRGEIWVANSGWWLTASACQKSSLFDWLPIWWWFTKTI